ncbi:MAG: NUDIX domain-containing protein [Cytophagaceae bacterium]|jgi:8-oxo-dGTP diphosphatase|nr:NUDIX domain-containing protein [Cytophagaceae bacterium]
MNSKEEEVVKQYGNRLRVRVCGILEHNRQWLLINHAHLGHEEYWMPPGGGMEYGEEAALSLQREFLEEAGIAVEITNFICVHEFLEPPLHGIELFFKVKQTGGTVALGSDPEMAAHQQILKEIRWCSHEELRQKNPTFLHPVLRAMLNATDENAIQGYAMNGRW